MADSGSASATEPLRWGILGPSAVARRFADELATSDTGRLRAVASRRLEQARSFVGDDEGVDSYGSYAELLAADDVDAVYIATVPSSHVELAVEAAAAGKHALVEKPLTVTSAQAVAVVAAARAAGTSLAEAMLYRFHPQTELLLDLLRDGAIGEVLGVEASCGSMVEPWPGASRSDPALGGGTIVSVGCYPVSVARLVAGAAAGRPFLDPESLTGVGTLGETGVDEWAVATLRFGTGVTARVAAGVRAGDDNTVKVYGSRGHLLVPLPWLVPSPDAGAVVLTTVGRGRRTLRSAPARPYALAVDALARAGRGGQVPQIGWDDSVGNARTLDEWRAAVGMRFPFEG